MNNNKFKQIATLMLGGTLMLGSIGCTESFEDYNTNPKAPTPEQMEGDFASTAALISTMIPVMVQGQAYQYQSDPHIRRKPYRQSSAHRQGSNMRRKTL